MDNVTLHVYPVYILSRVVSEIFSVSQQAVPHETLGRLLGYRSSWQGRQYVKIVDWVGGELESSHTHARITAQGARECEIFLDERYGDVAHRPVEVGLFHSHPFGSDPHFSATDYDTFLTFPYDQEGNAFVLIDPLSAFFKVFIVAVDGGQKDLQQVTWISYHPK